MCSRYSLTSPPAAVARLFGTVNEVPHPPRYNIAPTQPVVIVRLGHQLQREMALVRWGLIPGWVKDPRTFTTLINARAETALEKPSFKAALRHKRCLIPADAFYEFIGPARGKRPMMMTSKAGELMALAGIYEYWLGADGSEMETTAILTVAANGTMASFHDRMPALINPSDFDRWLDVKTIDSREAHQLLRPAPDDVLKAKEVSATLNNVRHEGPELQHSPSATLL
jgi:putative SOS response-associated peptidase YedK